MLGVELGIGPWGPLSWLHLCGVALALLYPKDIFPQEGTLLGFLVHPECFFEVPEVWGSGVLSAWLPKQGPELGLL